MHKENMARGQEDQIMIRGLACECLIGVYDFERLAPQALLLDLDLSLGYTRAGKSDDLTDGLDYGDLTAFVVATCQKYQPLLLESLAESIIRDLFDRYALLTAVRLAVHKPNAPLTVQLDSLCVSLFRRRSEKVLLALGSNLGDRQAHMTFALKSLMNTEGLSHFNLSSIYESKAWGVTDQADFLNACIECRTSLSPFEILKRCQEIEQESGRTREIHWGPRTLDIDLIDFGNRRIQSPDLILPHPYAEEREFVKVPRLEIECGQSRHCDTLKLYWTAAEWMAAAQGDENHD